MKRFLFISIFLVSAHFSFAAYRYWVADQAANWSDAANWSTQSGGQGGASIPGEDDYIRFDGNGLGDCILDIEIDVKSLDLRTGYTGSVIQSDLTLRVRSFIRLYNGLFQGGTGAILCDRNLIIAGGTFISTSGTMNIRGYFKILTGSFVHNEGLVEFDNYSNKEYRCDIDPAPWFYDVAVQVGNGKKKKIRNGDTLKVINRIDLYNGELEGGTLELEGNCYTHPDFSDIDSDLCFSGHGNSLFYYHDSAKMVEDLSLRKGPSDTLKIIDSDGNGSITLGRTNKYLNIYSGTLVFADDPDVILKFKKLILHPDGTLVSTPKALVIERSFSNLGGTFFHNEGTFVFDGIGNVDYSKTGGQPDVFHKVIFDKSNGRDVLIASGDTITIQDSLILNDGQVKGGFLNAQGPVVIGSTFDQGRAPLILSGARDQTFTNHRSDRALKSDLIIDKDHSSRVYLRSKLYLNDSSRDLYLNNGYLVTTRSHILRIGNNVEIQGGDEDSHVIGPIEKIGNDAFEFPVGRDGVYAPIHMSAPQNHNHSFVAEYFSESADSRFSTDLMDISLNHVSNHEFWILDREIGSSNVYVTLCWQMPRSGTIEEISDLVISRWDGSSWRDHGNNTSSIGAPYGDQGTVRSELRITEFSPFTFASRSQSNPLPVEFLFFKAELKNKKVELKWATGVEINADNFLVQRSKDGIEWETIDDIPAAGFSSNRIDYASQDLDPLQGLSYYRLKQIDFDGKFDFTDMEAVYNGIIEEETLLTYPNPTEGLFTLEGPVHDLENIRMYDISGRDVTESLTIKELSSSMSMIDMTGNTEGIYLLWVDNRSIKLYYR